MDTLSFKSLSVLDFMEESKKWKTEDFLNNVRTHKEELKKLTISEPSSLYYGCRFEIMHLTDFLKKLLFYYDYHTVPYGISDEDYARIKELHSRHNEQKAEINNK